MYRFRIELTPKSKKNSRPIYRNAKTGKTFLGKDKSLVEYEKACHLILTSQKNVQGIKSPITGKLRVKYIFEFKGKCRADGDNLQVGANDVLQAAHIFENDKQIKEAHWIIREDTGRLDQTLIEIEQIGVKESPADALSVIQAIFNK